MTNFLLFIFALTLITLLAIPLFLIQVVRYITKGYDLSPYFYALALSLDYLGATLIYGAIGHTVSAITYGKSTKGDRLHIQFEKLINWIFQDDEHCKKAYIKEYGG